MTKEEAKNNLKRLIGFSDICNEAIFTLFPEFKKDEDEKIRKEILNIISSLGSGIIPIPENQVKMIDYLEKLKESSKKSFTAEDCQAQWDAGVEYGKREGNTIGYNRAIREMWRPTEDQLSALNAVVDEYEGWLGDRLYSLYQDLENLID